MPFDIALCSTVVTCKIGIASLQAVECCNCEIGLLSLTGGVII